MEVRGTPIGVEANLAPAGVQIAGRFVKGVVGIREPSHPVRGQDAGCTVCYESVIVGHNYRNVEEARFEFLKLLWNSWPHPCHLFLPLIIMHKHHHLKPISSNDLFPWLLMDTTVLVGTCSMDGKGKKTT